MFKVDIFYISHMPLQNGLSVIKFCSVLSCSEETLENLLFKDVYISYYLSSAVNSYFSFQPVLHDWCDKGCGMCYPVCGMMHIKEPLLLIRKSSLCRGSGFPLSLSVWSFTICLSPYNRK